MAGAADASGTGGMEPRWFLQPEKCFYRVFIDFGADDAELAGDVGAAVSYVSFARNVVEVDPVAVFAGNDALGAEDHAEVAAVELFEGSLDRSLGEGLRGLKANGIEDFVSVVMTLMVVVVMIMLVLVIMVMAAAGAIRAVVVVVVVMMFVLIVIVVMMLMVMLIIIVFMLMLMIMVVAAAGAVRAVVVMVVMFMVMLVIIVFMLMIMVVVVAAAGAVRAMVVMVVMFVFFCFEECSGHVVCGERVLDRFSDLCAGELLPRGGDDLGVVVDLADQLDRGVELALGDVAGTGQDDGAGILDLVLVELLEVLQVDLALAGVDDGNSAADLGALDLLDSSHYVRELADTGWLDEDTVRRELVDDFLQRGAEVADEGAADAAGVHLGDLDAGFFQESAVDADLSEFILDEDELLSVVTIGNEFLDESCFSGA